MEFIKQIIFFLLIPVVTYGQTVHIDSNRIVYKGTVKLDAVNKDKLYARARNAMFNNVKQISIVTDNKEKGMISAKGSIKLASPYHIIKKVEYILELSADDGKYKYRIDSVSSANVEKQLNEIDMNFQKLIALVNADMKKAAVVKNQK